jgi:hypothetical protein
LTTWQISVRERGVFPVRIRTVNLFLKLEIWVSLHHHPVVLGHFRPLDSQFSTWV